MADHPENPKIGYKRPPQHTQFQKGSSGNPRGRPRGTRNLATDLAEELAERIPIREGEIRLRVSKQRALLKALIAKALKGDTRASGLVLRMIDKLISPIAEDAGPSAEISDEDSAILERFLTRQREGRGQR
jgi:Family of unknown function (DUF5681)